ncbi:hypothetical protein EVAR_82872_1 [Eumeta japonica]|uniref:BESS domain-containing protein n=1 Tax=Eumeta variegata TaxID=151549 RepID=A0A4C1V438_EUMVA|nr:hypothetical protein EVAR_82872_1 [Eumeta japonica]
MGEPSKRKGRTSAEPVAECMSKWRNIRCAYLRSIKCAANETKLTKPYYLHEHLEFVLPFLKPKLISILESQDENSQVDLTSQLDVKPESSMSSVEESDEENTPQKFTDTPIDNVAEAGRKRKAISGYVDYIEAKANTVRDDDATRHFVLGLLPELNAMNDIQRREFKIKVILLIDEILSR